MSALRLHPRAHAHGKTIVLGEHSVVYGMPALAAGLPDALTLTAEPLPDPRASSVLCIPAWSLDVPLTVESEHPVVRACLEVLGHCDGPVTGWRIDGSTQLPAGAGLGSSAALTVALARLVLGPDADLDSVVDASMAGERIFHGEPSGIDSEVAARGGLVRFVRGQPVTSVSLGQPLPLMVVPSGVERSTALQVAKVRERHDRHPTVAVPLLRALGEAVDRGIEALAAADYPALGEIMQMAHETLSAFGVSSPILDALCSTALRSGALGAKLTGAGGGGCIVVLPGDDPAAITEAYRVEGYTPLSVELPPS